MSTSPDDQYAGAQNPQGSPNDAPPAGGWSLGGAPQQPDPWQLGGNQPGHGGGPAPGPFPGPGYPQQGGPYNPYMPYGGAPVFPPAVSLASWAPRFGATLLDALMGLPFIVAAFIILAASSTSATYDADTAEFRSGGPSGVGVLIALLLYLGAIVFAFYQLYRQGKTGQTIGKRVVGIRVIRERDGQPTGFGMAFVRSLAHILDSLACYIGWLWPLWDAKKQTFADKVCGTIVVLD